MGGYRVSVESEDPLAIDEGLAQSQRFWKGLLIHGLITVVSMGFWFPVLLGWLVVSGSSLKKLATGYTVSVRGGMLVVGNDRQSRSVPLDAVADVSISKGYVTVAVRGAQPVQLFGLRDPSAAARAILEAREQHVRGVRVDVREEVLSAEVGVAREQGARR